MHHDHTFYPRRRGDRTGRSPLILLMVLAVPVALAAFARSTDRDWWITPAIIAAVIAVTASIGLWIAWHEGIGKTLVVREDVVELVRQRRDGVRTTVVRRNAPAFAVAFAAVRRGPDSPGTDRTLLLADGRESIRLVEPTWSRKVLSEVAALLDVTFDPEWTTRADIAAAVGQPAASWERRPYFVALLVALGTVALALIVAAGVVMVGA